MFFYVYIYLEMLSLKSDYYKSLRICCVANTYYILYIIFNCIIINNY